MTNFNTSFSIDPSQENKKNRIRRGINNKNSSNKHTADSAMDFDARSRSLQRKDRSHTVQNNYPTPSFHPLASTYENTVNKTRNFNNETAKEEEKDPSLKKPSDSDKPSTMRDKQQRHLMPDYSNSHSAHSNVKARNAHHRPSEAYGDGTDGDPNKQSTHYSYRSPLSFSLVHELIPLNRHKQFRRNGLNLDFKRMKQVDDKNVLAKSFNSTYTVTKQSDVVDYFKNTKYNHPLKYGRGRDEEEAKQHLKYVYQDPSDSACPHSKAHTLFSGTQSIFNSETYNPYCGKSNRSSLKPHSNVNNNRVLNPLPSVSTHSNHMVNKRFSSNANAKDKEHKHYNRHINFVSEEVQEYLEYKNQKVDWSSRHQYYINPEQRTGPGTQKALDKLLPLSPSLEASRKFDYDCNIRSMYTCDISTALDLSEVSLMKSTAKHFGVDYSGPQEDFNIFTYLYISDATATTTAEEDKRNQKDNSNLSTLGLGGNSRIPSVQQHSKTWTDATNQNSKQYNTITSSLRNRKVDLVEESLKMFESRIKVEELTMEKVSQQSINTNDRLNDYYDEYFLTQKRQLYDQNVIANFSGTCTMNVPTYTAFNLADCTNYENLNQDEGLTLVNTYLKEIEQELALTFIADVTE